VRTNFVVAMVTCACLQGCASTDLSGLPDLPAGRTISFDGESIFVRQSGEGPDVVLLHGLGDSSLGWQFLEEPLLQAGYRVTVWDALGAGRSSKPSGGDYSLAAHLRRLVRVLDALAIENAAIVGHSLGGSLALGLAQAHPGRTAALCLIDPAAYREGAMGGRWFWDTPWIAEIVLGLLPTETIVDFGLEQNFADTTRIPGELRRLYLREARRDATIRALIEQERQLVPDDAEAWENGHRTIRAPTLILWGAKDALVPVAQGHRLVCDIADAELVVLAELAHSPQLESPATVLAHLLPFLETRRHWRRGSGWTWASE
jgi:pimeloyl-ACP methyl ester carboxylesterase